MKKRKNDIRRKRSGDKLRKDKTKKKRERLGSRKERTKINYGRSSKVKERKEPKIHRLIITTPYFTFQHESNAAM